MSKKLIICINALMIMGSAASAQNPAFIAGYTWYECQAGGSSGNRIAICDDRSLYVTWTWLPTWPYPQAPRHVYFNWRSPNGEWSFGHEGAPVSLTPGAGYSNLDLIYGNRAAIAYHSAGGSNPTYITLSVDIDPPGIGFFDHYDPPDEIFPQNPDNPGRMFWPYITVDRNDIIHLVMTENTSMHFRRTGYTRSTDGGSTWIDPQVVDTVMLISSVIDASPVSERVVIAYARSQDTTTQVENDIYYVLSNNGLDWNFQNGRVNITNYGDDPDSLWAGCDIDVIFDYDDYFHIVWTESYVTSNGGSLFHTDIKHYSEETEEISTAVYSHVESTWYDICDTWNKPVCKMNLGVYQGPPEAIFLTYTRFDTTDISSGGYGNGEIYMTYSDNGGSDWTDPINLTNSPTPGCFPGDCNSDHWSTLADVVDYHLHITYINDKDAGGIPQTEGAATNNPVMYLAYPNPLLAIRDNANRPIAFSLDQNRPNPFNAKTTISFQLKEPADVTLAIFDITGAKVATLVNGHLPAGPHDIIWNAQDAASGIYIYRLTTGGISYSRRAVLLK